jgi:hypothetical protein
MAANDRRDALPVEGAFVVHLRPGSDPEKGRMAGRVEHFASGRREEFGSLPELVAFLGRVLRNLRQDLEQGEVASGEERWGTHVGPAS